MIEASVGAGVGTVKAARVIRWLRTAVIALLALYGLIFVTCVSFLIKVLPSFMHHAGSAAFWTEIRLLFGKVLTMPLYVYVGYKTFQLTSLVLRGVPFDPACPRHIRKIAYSVFILALFAMIGSTIHEWTSPGASFLGVLIQALYNGLSPLLVGFGFLVIGKVLESGVRLQQEQNLTV